MALPVPEGTHVPPAVKICGGANEYLPMYQTVPIKKNST
jgi:hypothetical protein